MYESLLNLKDLKMLRCQCTEREENNFQNCRKVEQKFMTRWVSWILKLTDESVTLVNDTESGIVIVSCRLNLECLCNDMTNFFIDGTFKYCLKYFYQLYSLHGCKNGNAIALVLLCFLLKVRIVILRCGTFLLLIVERGI